MMNEMTAVEAIRQIKENCYFASISENTKQALDKAIKALEQQPCEDCVSRSELQKTMDSLPLFRFVNNGHEEADDYYNCESVDMVIRNLPSVTPKYTDEEIDKAQAVEQAYVDKMVELAVEESKRPKGKWIEYKVDIAPHPLHCSLCGFSNHHISNRYMREFRRCPNCGADMRGGEDGNSN